MTDEERIKSILSECEHDYIGYDNLHGDNEQGIRLIAEALKKQVPKKPDRTSRPYECPACGSWEGVRSDGWYLPPYCCMCGTKLDWSVDNDY